ncbi:hypothetical protein KUTeg_008928 [Tegillarca granosa]|uniref:Pituitary tumor-transforming gene 1 protein-interacting protein-like n=1 Tax=Tegillarca granosa TaxID=220873 RepID=A0ABQ9FEV3_TEGGR|nr:hypothetical protein KUTeg_008928 [Tegillarca granosa]
MSRDLRIVLLTFVCSFVVVIGQTSNGSATMEPTTKVTKPSTKNVPTTHEMTTQHPGPTLSPEQACAARNGSCSDCVALAQCLWCFEHNTCMLYPTGEVLPTKHCALSKARWGVCWVNFEALIITMAVIGGIILLALTVCICCCCCCKNKKSKYAKEDAKMERKTEERKAKQSEKRAERKARTDEIRRKYGLIKEDNPYQRFDEA